MSARHCWWGGGGGVSLNEVLAQAANQMGEFQAGVAHCFPANSGIVPVSKHAGAEVYGNDSFRTPRYHSTNCSFSAI